MSVLRIMTLHYTRVGMSFHYHRSVPHPATALKGGARAPTELGTIRL